MNKEFQEKMKRIKVKTVEEILKETEKKTSQENTQIVNKREKVEYNEIWTRLENMSEDEAYSVNIANIITEFRYNLEYEEQDHNDISKDLDNRLDAKISKMAESKLKQGYNIGFNHIQYNKNKGELKIFSLKDEDEPPHNLIATYKIKRGTPYNTLIRIVAECHKGDIRANMRNDEDIWHGF